MATSDIMIDNKRTRVTRWSFEAGEDTGQHIHEFDYVVVPMEDASPCQGEGRGFESHHSLKKVLLNKVLPGWWNW